MDNALLSPKDIDFPDNFTGTITVKQCDDTKVDSVVYEFENSKLKSIMMSYKDDVKLCQN